MSLKRSNFSSLGHLFREFKELGLQGSLFRMQYEVKRRWIYPWIELLGKNFKIPAPTDLEQVPWFQTLKHWKDQGLLSQKLLDIDALVSLEQRTLLKQRAAQIFEGKIVAFSHLTLNYGQPWKWHWNPISQKQWPSDLHHFRALQSDPRHYGDVKVLWELSRFHFLHPWIRMHLRHDFGKAEFLERWVSDWLESNPYPLGVHWSSGQELAIRILNFSFAVATLGFKDRELLASFLSLHGLHLQRHLDFARYAVHNNHFILEAVALIALSQWLLHEPWARLGRDALEQALDRQFYPDGGYCQYSHNYHRLALHALLWARRMLLSSSHSGTLVLKIEKALVRSAEYLYQTMDLSTGTLPNWGNNDGALLQDWTYCDFRDFRPLLNSIALSVLKQRWFKFGPWDEEALYFGMDPWKITEVQAPRARRYWSFKWAGLHGLRPNAEQLGILRCGPMLDRFGQADQLHFDLFVQGKNIALDGGSYCYNDERIYHQWFMNSASHNTVVVDQKSQMLLWRPFKWLYWAQGKLLEIRKNYLKGEWLSEKRWGVKHLREVRYEKRGHDHYWHVSDLLTPVDGKVHLYQLHWRLLDLAWKFGESWGKVLARSGTVQLSISGLEKMDQEQWVVHDFEWKVFDDLKRDKPMASHSPRYLELQKAIDLLCEMRTPHAVRWNTLFVVKEI